MKRPHESRSIGTVAAELQAAEPVHNNLLDSVADAWTKLREKDTMEAFRHYCTLKEQEFAARTAVQDLRDELKELEAAEDVSQKRARLDSSYQEALAEFKAAVAVVSTLKPEVAAAQSAFALKQKEYDALCVKLHGARKRVLQVKDKHHVAIKAYCDTFAVPYKRNDPCPCGKRIVMVGTRVLCKGKCEFHIAGGVSTFHGDQVNLHRGPLAACELLQCASSSVTN